MHEAYGDLVMEHNCFNQKIFPAKGGYEINLAKLLTKFIVPTEYHEGYRLEWEDEGLLKLYMG